MQNWRLIKSHLSMCMVTREHFIRLPSKFILGDRRKGNGGGGQEHRRAAASSGAAYGYRPWALLGGGEWIPTCSATHRPISVAWSVVRFRFVVASWWRRLSVVCHIRWCFLSQLLKVDWKTEYRGQRLIYEANLNGHNANMLKVKNRWARFLSQLCQMSNVNLYSALTSKPLMRWTY